ncbi:hypothetical protein [Amycolatopsis sp. cmx-4-68]|uniref:hypothetical protein n=1 Tax=Amycolatopsis sp. cmx-4-68 TaxID=2790938 RepID=UPI00397BA9AE
MVHCSKHGDPAYDCAIVALGTRGFANEVPNRPWHPGNRALRGTAVAVVGDRVYKYGATTGYTTGTVKNTTLTSTNRTGNIDVQNAILIEGDDGQIWCNGGDSGSVVVRYDTDEVVAINFRADFTSGDEHGYKQGLAYDIATQVALFSSAVTLAESPKRTLADSSPA